MTGRELRQQLRAQRQALRTVMKDLRQKARAQLDANPLVQRARRRRKIGRAVGLAAIAVLLLLLRCECSTVPQIAEVDAGPVPLAPPVPKPSPAKKPGPDKKSKPGPMEAKLSPQPRGRYEPPPPAAPPWLEEFRLQVAARSPRLAQCFEGADRPGALRWSTAVNAQSGKVSGHELEPLRKGASLDQKQRECVLGVLSEPKYLLGTWDDDDQAAPRRVSIVIEF
ncbi:MAG: hypothetical protein IRZ16_20940 [Myxococcaceae bacterium]|nr:hypothetical protein [Myxococcaceae bacterium]